MSNVVIDLPEKFILEVPYRVLYSDINAANHLGADRVLPIAMEGQMQLVKHLGYGNALIFEDAGLIMVSAETRYLSEAFYADELLLKVGATNFTEKSFELVYCIYNTSQDRETARVRATMLFFDYNEHKVVKLPPGFLERLNTA